jgi:hypothetical protein
MLNFYFINFFKSLLKVRIRIRYDRITDPDLGGQVITNRNCCYRRFVLGSINSDVDKKSFCVTMESLLFVSTVVGTVHIFCRHKTFNQFLVFVFFKPCLSVAEVPVSL